MQAITLITQCQRCNKHAHKIVGLLNGEQQTALCQECTTLIVRPGAQWRVRSHLQRYHVDIARHTMMHACSDSWSVELDAENAHQAALRAMVAHNLTQADSIIVATQSLMHEQQQRHEFYHVRIAEKQLCFASQVAPKRS